MLSDAKVKYLIKSLPNKKSKPNWKLQFRSFKKEDLEKHRLKHPRHKTSSITQDISKELWRSHGFHKNLSFDEAKELAKQQNINKNVFM